MGKAAKEELYCGMPKLCITNKPSMINGERENNETYCESYKRGQGCDLCVHMAESNNVIGDLRKPEGHKEAPPQMVCISPGM